MAPGHQRCMYCGDSQGTDIDHFEPKSRAPLRTFEWLNHLLACAYCNSNQKRNRFPRSETDGSPLLLDPTLQEPLEHLRLVLPVGTYKGLTPQGDACIAVFGLNNRGALVDGRRTAYVTAKHSVELWRIATDRGRHDKGAEIVRAAWNRPSGADGASPGVGCDQAERRPPLSAVTNEDQPSAEKTTAGPSAALLSRTGTAAWPRATSRHSPWFPPL
ncbi:hypothetical protein SSIG_02186 [Streptomyces filamentosus NRRL 11379]|uniref:HNH domain-containing protein n=1 Tax=Streptomyces filamentosus NRRL 15998 TaxID=457431 RepID=D6ADC3_STRFL|nr:conserved hypothetical protein [Streptomyces filamentosus NRRL 15998]EWS91736.1 hypothetical protein SSIG_02186 [Streptomyces filamentosus NRRL 11379]